MNFKKNRIKVYTLLYLLIFLGAIAGLVINIRMVSLNDKIQKTTQMLHDLKEENELQLTQIQTRLSLPSIDEISKKSAMHFPEKIILLDSNSQYSNEK